MRQVKTIAIMVAFLALLICFAGCNSRPTPKITPAPEKSKAVALPPEPMIMKSLTATNRFVVPPPRGHTNDVHFDYAKGMKGSNYIWGIRGRVIGTTNWTVVWLNAQLDRGGFVTVTNALDNWEFQSFGSPRK